MLRLTPHLLPHLNVRLRLRQARSASKEVQHWLASRQLLLGRACRAALHGLSSSKEARL
jgi:hypothetical protein